MLIIFPFLACLRILNLRVVLGYVEGLCVGRGCIMFLKFCLAIMIVKSITFVLSSRIKIVIIIVKSSIIGVVLL